MRLSPRLSSFDEPQHSLGNSEASGNFCHSTGRCPCSMYRNRRACGSDGLDLFARQLLGCPSFGVAISHVVSVRSKE